MEAIKDKDRLLAQAKTSGNQQDWANARRHRNEVKRMVKNAKSEFIRENLDQYQNNSKKFWKSLKDVIPSATNANISLKKKIWNFNYRPKRPGK